MKMSGRSISGGRPMSPVGVDCTISSLAQDRLAVVKQADESPSGVTLLITFGEEGARSDANYEPAAFGRDFKIRRKP